MLEAFVSRCNLFFNYAGVLETEIVSLWTNTTAGETDDKMRLLVNYETESARLYLPKGLSFLLYKLSVARIKDIPLFKAGKGQVTVNSGDRFIVTTTRSYIYYGLTTFLTYAYFWEYGEPIKARQLELSANSKLDPNEVIGITLNDRYYTLDAVTHKLFEFQSSDELSDFLEYNYRSSDF